jgi:hypothetical protein
MGTSQHKEWACPQIVALVELDLQKMRVRIVLAREAIRERLRELEPASGTTTGNIRASSAFNLKARL